MSLSIIIVFLKDCLKWIHKIVYAHFYPTNVSLLYSAEPLHVYLSLTILKCTKTGT